MLIDGLPTKLIAYRLGIHREDDRASQGRGHAKHAGATISHLVRMALKVLGISTAPTGRSR